MRYRVAIAISGAVSLGAYEAGTLYEIIRALEEHNSNPDNPRIEIDVLTGASAGGMTAAMLAQKLLYDGSALMGETDNVGYQAWVKSVDIDGLLTMVSGDNENNSLLSNGFIRKIADSLINNRYQLADNQLSHPPQKPHIASAKEIRLGLAMSNLNGIDYQVDTLAYLHESIGNTTFTQTRYQDRFSATLNKHTDTRKTWLDITSAARGCGAFPVAFSPVKLLRQWQHDDYSMRGAVEFSEQPFNFMDGGAFNNYPLGMAVELAEKNDTEYTDYENRFYFYVSPTPRETTANFDFDSATAGFAGCVKQMINSVFLQSGFQEWLIQEQDNDKVLRLDSQADALRKRLYITSDQEVAQQQEIINLMIDVVYGGKNNEYYSDITRLAEQYRVDLKDRPLSEQHFTLWIDTIAVIEHAAGLGPTNLKTIYTITAQKGELSGELLGSFLGFFDERFRHYDYQRGRLNAMLAINGILAKQKDSLVTQSQLPLNIRKRDYASVRQFIDSSELNHASMTDVKIEHRQRTLKRVKSRFFMFAEEAGIGLITRTLLWNFVVKKPVKNALAL